MNQENTISVSKTKADKVKDFAKNIETISEKIRNGSNESGISKLTTKNN